MVGIRPMPCHAAVACASRACMPRCSPSQHGAHLTSAASPSSAASCRAACSRCRSSPTAASDSRSSHSTCSTSPRSYLLSTCCTRLRTSGVVGVVGRRGRGRGRGRVEVRLSREGQEETSARGCRRAIGWRLGAHSLVVTVPGVSAGAAPTCIRRSRSDHLQSAPAGAAPCGPLRPAQLTPARRAAPPAHLQGWRWASPPRQAAPATAAARGTPS